MKGDCTSRGFEHGEKLSTVEKLIEARKSKGSLKQKKGQRMKHLTAKLTIADGPAGKKGGGSVGSWKLN
jgi:hypothetical protein